MPPTNELIKYARRESLPLRPMLDASRAQRLLWTDLTVCVLKRSLSESFPDFQTTANSSSFLRTFSLSSLLLFDDCGWSDFNGSIAVYIHCRFFRGDFVWMFLAVILSANCQPTQTEDNTTPSLQVLNHMQGLLIPTNLGGGGGVLKTAPPLSCLYLSWGPSFNNL